MADESAGFPVQNASQQIVRQFPWGAAVDIPGLHLALCRPASCSLGGEIQRLPPTLAIWYQFTQRDPILYILLKNVVFFVH